MAEELTQTLGFDATQALQTLAQLDSLMANAERTAARFATTLGRFSGQNAKVQLGQIGTATEDVGKKAKATSKSWAVSMETMARVVQTQFIVRALNQIRTVLVNTTQDALDFLGYRLSSILHKYIGSNAKFVTLLLYLAHFVCS